MFIDAMAHLNDPRVEDLETVLERAKRAGITHIINAGVDPCLDQELPNSTAPLIYKAYGIHPMAVGKKPLNVQLDSLRERLAEDRVVAIGEIGLDKRAGMPDWNLQVEAFQAQLALAQTLNLPVIIHCVKATGLLLQELHQGPELIAGGLWHGYTGSVESVNQIENAGLHISLGGQVSYPNAKKCRQAAAVIQSNRLLVESDSPDHPPSGWEHTQSEPAALEKTLLHIAQIRSESLETVRAQTAENAKRLFKLDCSIC